MKTNKKRFILLDVETRAGHLSRRAYEIKNNGDYVKSRPPKTLICTFLGIAIATSAAKALQALQERTGQC